MRKEPHTLFDEDIDAAQKDGYFIAAMVDLLLRLYVGCRREALPSLTLSQSRPLGPFGTEDSINDLTEVGNFLEMSNRLKVLADLNPVLYQEPVTATLTVTVKDGATGAPRDQKLRLYFDDRCADPFCRIEMDQTPQPASAAPV
jgi:hypothetical protein